jgi:hypothetical protein|tara:strand:- start:618 stop:1331 length:714 start_codon:yes stop_codon:yes gene_type:complete
MGLQTGDLRDLVYDIFEIDSFKSKMGDDKNIVVMSFSARTKESANDLMNFIEKGYPFVLDADVTSGEQADGTYKVFVEMERNKEVPKQVVEIIDGVQKLSNLDKMKFRYYKSFKSNDTNPESLAEVIPLDNDAYDIKVNENNMENYKNFFNKSYIDSIEMLNDDITFKKIYADPLTLKVVDFGKSDEMDKAVTESYNINSWAETIYLTKYLGDYDIEKYGDKIMISNNGYTVVTTRN